MFINQKPLFLLDLDDTLLDTTKLKNDLFLNIARAIDPESVEQNKAEDIKRLYNIFCTQNNGIFSYQGFADFLIRIFHNQEQEIKNCFQFDFQDYLLPEAKVFVEELKNQGRVLIWTTGTFADQAKKLLDTGLISKEEAVKILPFDKFETMENKPDNLPLAVVDTGKVLGINKRLNWFLQNFPQAAITFIDNEVKNIAAAYAIQNEYLRVIWLDHGEQKNPQLADELRNRPTTEVNRFNSLSKISDFLKIEGASPSSEQKG